MELLDLLRPALARLTRRNFALSPEVQLLAALRFFATWELHRGRGRGLRPKQDLGVEVRPHCHQRPSASCRGILIVKYLTININVYYIIFRSR